MAAWLRRCLEVMVPDATQDVIGRPCVVLAPHPDDEVLGCGGTIARKLQHGTDVAAVFLTDGSRGASGPPDHVRSVREAEARRAAGVLGLRPDRLSFLGFEDGRLSEHLDEAVCRLRRSVTTMGILDVFVPYGREYHADHVAAWVIGGAILPPGGRLYEYPIWFGPWLWDRLAWRARLAASRHLLDIRHAVKISITSVAEIKRRALAAYASQVSAFSQQGSWGPAFLSGFVRDYELFFLRR